MDSGWIPWPFGDLGGFCLVLVRGLDPESIINRYGPHAVVEGWLDHEDAIARHRPGVGGVLLRSGVLGDWGFCFEQGATSTLFVGIQSALSAGTQTITLCDVPEGASTILLVARDGQVTANIEIGMSVLHPGPDTAALLAELGEVDTSVPGEEVRRARDVIAGRIGRTVDVGMLAGPLLTAWLPTDHVPRA